jgi:hypothetical protein
MSKVALDLAELRGAASTMRRFAGRSYRGAGKASFCSINGTVYLVAGEFASVLAGTKVGYENEFIEANLIDKHFRLDKLVNWLGASFMSNDVSMEFKDGRIIFRVGRNRVSLPTESSPMSPYIDLPESGMGIDGLKQMARVAHLASTNPTSPYSGVGVVIDSGYAHMIATDGFSMGYVWGVVPEDAAPREANISGEMFLGIRHIDWGDVYPKLWMNDSKVWVYNDDHFMISPLMKKALSVGEVIQSIRNHGGEDYALVSLTDIIDKLRALTQFDREKNVSAVTFHFTEEFLRLYVSEAEQGEGEFFLASTEFEDTFKVNGHGVQAIARLLQDSRSMDVKISRHDEAEWMVIRSDDTNGLFCMATMAF